jgi:hypothetical protein
MKDRERIIGRVVYKNDVNEIYPKFTILSPEPFLEGVFESWDELDAGVGEDEEIFEPLSYGLGSKTNLMYVKTEEGTFLFSYILTDIRWGSEVVIFSDEVDFEGNTLLSGF